jgi:hypothetical protein
MMGEVLGPAHWAAARRRRAMLGKAPRLAVRRVLMLREYRNGQWRAAICAWRFGRWLAPEWLCEPCSLKAARSAAFAVWRAGQRMPAAWQYATDSTARPLRFGQNEPRAVTA